jgi:hypothetical protein
MEIVKSERVFSLILPSLHPSVGGMKRYIRYKTNMVELNDDNCAKLLSLLPPFWHTDKDRIIHFTITSDGTFLCEREKEVYDYSTKTTDKKVYIFDGATKEDVKELTNVLYKFFEEEYVKQVTNIQSKIVGELRHLSFLKEHFLRLRNQFLSSSDFRVLPDYPIDDYEKQKWIEYRQQLRDITKQEAWENKNYIDIKFPVSPSNEEQAIEIVTYLKSNGIDFSDYRTTDDNAEEQMAFFIENLSLLTAKKAIINILVNIGLPSINNIIFPEFPEFTLNDYVKSPYQDVKIFSDIDNLKNQIETELRKIDENITFDKIYEMIKEATKMLDIEKEVEDILIDLENEQLGE